MLLSHNTNSRSSSDSHYISNAAILKRAWCNVIRLKQSITVGAYESMFRSNGLDYVGSREYMFGDDSRHIDWNVTARLQNLHTKSFLEERSQTMWCVCDISASMEIGAPRSLLHVSAEIGATLLLLAYIHKDKTGAITFSDDVQDVFQVSSLVDTVARFVSSCVDKKVYKQESDLYNALLYSKNALSQHSSIIIISDFFTPRLEEALALVSQYHDIFAVRVRYDVHAMKGYRSGHMYMRDTEDEMNAAVMSFSKMHEKYFEWFKQYDKNWKNICRFNKMKCIDVTSKSSILYVLLRYMKYKLR